MNTPGAPRIRVSGVRASGPTDSLWLRILVRCLAVTGSALLVVVLVAFLLHGAGGAGSAAFGYAVVALFFGVSLLVGHFVGRTNPSGALGIFIVTYLIKVVGFALVLFLIGTPPWLERAWFFGSAVGAVVLWQIVEVAVFARSRHQLYDDADGQSARPKAVDRRA